MKIQTPTEFLTFNDGWCDIYTTKNNKLDEKALHLRFGERTVGMKRFYTARAATAKIDRLIQIPRQSSITTADKAIIGNDLYDIEQAQHLPNTNPPITLLSLQKVGLK